MTTVCGCPTQIVVRTAGIQGAPGAVWRNGSGAPSNSLGIDGDYYLNVTNGDVYYKAAGVYTVVANIDGAPGSVWRNGSGAPSNSLGVNGDYYLDDASGNVYYKAAGAYTIVANITGAPGTPGSVWRNGTGVPSNSLGINGDYYLNDSNGDVYLKASGTYSVVANIEGPAGTAGVGVPSGGTSGQVLAKIDSTNYNTHWVNQSGGGGFISTQRAISSGTTDTATTGDGLILWNSAAAGTKLQTIPASSGSLQVIIIMDFYGNSDAHPIIIAAATGNINNTLPSVSIGTPGGSLTLLDSILGWVLQ